MRIQRSADRRRDGIKGVIVGPSNVGKTSLLYTLDEETTFCADLEAGLQAVPAWNGASAPVTTWEEARMLAGVISGPKGSAKPGAPYSEEWLNKVLKHLKERETHPIDPDWLASFSNYFFDSITVASRLSFDWCRKQPECYSDTKKDAHGRPAFDTRAAYGLMAREIIEWMTVLQHARGKNVWFAGVLEEVKDDIRGLTWEIMMMGQKSRNEIKPLFDQVITMAMDEDGKRFFVCREPNKWGYPAKNRGDALDMIEKPDLGALMAKIEASQGKRPSFAPPITANDQQPKTEGVTANVAA